jgi:hypothetical protein
MSAKSIKSEGAKKPASAATNLIGMVSGVLDYVTSPVAEYLIAGGGAGMMEALACHPLGQRAINADLKVQSANKPQIQSKFECSCQGENERLE